MFTRRVAAALCALAVVTTCSAMGLSRDEMSSYNISMTLSPQEDTLAGAEWVDYVNDTGKPVGEVVFLL
ncbi:MAG: hypothetical protein NTY63_04350, partial [Candidatus Bipolaricaulota bacterium]|nr:hypothetical protein [Candidatus Bipolaricaulota bacterium]